MNFLKKNNKKLLFAFLCVFLLISFNVNTFAASLHQVCNLDEGSYKAYVRELDSSGNVLSSSDVTSSTGRGRATVNGRSCTAFRYDKAYKAYQKHLECGVDMALYPGYQYNYSGAFSTNYNLKSQSQFSISVFFIMTDGTNDFSVTLYQGSFNNSDGSAASWTDFSGNFIIPNNFSGNLQGALLIMVNALGSDSAWVAHDLYFTDFSFDVDHPLYSSQDPEPDPSNPFDDFDSSSSDLPDSSDVDLEDLMTFDFSDFTEGFSAVNKIFDRVTDALAIKPVILFCLTLGLATYIIGRKLSND